MTLSAPPRPIPEPSGVPLIDQPYHDGSAVCVSDSSPRPGDVADVRLWVPDSYPVRTIAARTIRDGETFNLVLAPGQREGAGRWWSVPLTPTGRLLRYRFCLIAPADGVDVPAYAWLNAAGLFPYDVSDSADFTLVTSPNAPEWVDDAVVYQVFPDRFARSGATYDLPDWAHPAAWDDAPLPAMGSGQQYFGGDLPGLASRLDHIASLGATVVYLTPIFPAGSVHRYDAESFDHVDPLLGGDRALSDLIAAAHARGIRVVLDLTTNHTGVTHEWFRRATSDPDAPERSYYHFTDYPDHYASWLDVPSLPKLDHRADALRDRLVRGRGSIAARWLSAPYGADGWRIDVANMTGRFGELDLAHQVAQDLRATLAEVEHEDGRGRWLVAEHGHDATRDLEGDGWHGTMNYAGFTRPLWAWLSGPDPADGLTWLGLPTEIPHLGGDAIGKTLSGYNAEMPWRSRCHSQNQIDSHDTPRALTVMGSVARQHVAAVAQFTLPGVPTIFMGDELALRGVNGESSRTTMPWADIDAGHVPATLDLYRRLGALRRDRTALRRGGLRMIHASADLIVYQRTSPMSSDADGRDMLVCLARDAHPGVSFDLGALRSAGATVLLRTGPVSASADRSHLEVRADGPGAIVLALDPAAT